MVARPPGSGRLVGMDVAIAGGHGQIAAAPRAPPVPARAPLRAIIRNPDHAADVEAAGAEPVVLDLEALAGVGGSPRRCEARTPWCSPPGPGRAAAPSASAPSTTRRGQADRRRPGRRRPPLRDGVDARGRPARAARGDAMRAYFEAKRDAEDALTATGLAHTIVRPGSLTDEPGTRAGHRGRPPGQGVRSPATTWPRCCWRLDSGHGIGPHDRGRGRRHPHRAGARGVDLSAGAVRRSSPPRFQRRQRRRSALGVGPGGAEGRG